MLYTLENTLNNLSSYLTLCVCATMCMLECEQVHMHVYIPAHRVQILTDFIGMSHAQ